MVYLYIAEGENAYNRDKKIPLTRAKSPADQDGVKVLQDRKLNAPVIR